MRNIKNSGFSLIELLITLVVVNILIAGSMMLVGTSSTATQQSNEISWRNIENDELIKMLTEEKYFSAISTYPQNADLKKCFTADGNLCKVNTDYLLTPIDLKTGQVVTSFSGSNEEIINNKITFRVHCKNNTAECDQADYFIVKAKTTLTKSGTVAFSTEKTSVVHPFAPKITSFIPDSTISSGRPFNAILYIDTSGSMLFAKDKIKDALDTFLVKLSAMNVNVAILPLSATIVTQRYFNWDPMDSSKKIYVDIKDVNPSEILYREERYSIDYGTQFQIGDSIILPTYRKIQFSPTESVSDRSAKVAAAKALIDHLFNINNSTYKDSSLCSLLHYFEGGSSPFSIDPMTPNLIMAITNEDDESYLTSVVTDVPTSGSDSYNSTFKYCMKELNRRVQKGPIQSSYYGKSFTYKVTFSALLTVDSAPVIKTVTTDIKTPYLASVANGSSCMTAPTLNAEVLNFLNTSPQYAGTYLGSLNILDCKYNNSTFFYINTVPDTGYCTTNESSYRTTYNYYIHNSCWENRQNEVGSIAASVTPMGLHSIVPFSSSNSLAHSTKDIALAVKDDITSLIGNSNFYFVPVIHSTGDLCPLTPGAQIGNAYVSLATKLSATNNITPICDSSFTSKIGELDTLMSKLAVNDFNLTLDMASNLTGIEVTRGSQILYPTNGVDYKIQGNILIFQTGYIQPTDIIRIFYQ